MNTPGETWSSVLDARGLIAVMLTLVSAGCSNPVTHTYIDVHVSIDRQTVSESQLSKVTSCEFQVLGAEVTASANIRCPENRVQYDVGTFQWTSSVSTGDLQFRVTIFDANLVAIGDATSQPVALSPGMHLETSVLVLGVAPVAPPAAPDAGDDASSGADGGIETDSDTSAPTDGSTNDAEDNDGGG